jgi:hypothetical protein
VVAMPTAADDVTSAWPAEQAEEALRRIVTVILHSRGPMGIREMAVLSLACDALGIDEPVMVIEPADVRPVAIVATPRTLLVG